MLEVEPLFVDNVVPRALDTGTLFAWGYNRFGELGQGTSAGAYGSQPYQYNSPIQVGALKTWNRIKPGWHCVFAQMGDGSLFVWGANGEGQLGIGDLVYRSSPVQLGATKNWSTFSCTTHSSGGIKDGKLYTWGFNNCGQLGNGVANYPYSGISSPVQIGSRTDWQDDSQQNWFAHGIIGGKLYAWGENDWGQLGFGTIDPSGPSGHYSPVQVGTRVDWIKVIQTINVTRFAMIAGGQLWGWGQNFNGELAQGTSGASYQRIPSPVQIGSDKIWSTGLGQIASGKYHTLGITTDGKLWAWGLNFYGELGLGDRVDRSSPVQIGTSTWLKVATGAHFSLGITTDGRLWSWGKNVYGRLGLGDVIPRSLPTQIGTASNWIDVGASIYSGFGIRRS